MKSYDVFVTRMTRRSSCAAKKRRGPRIARRPHPRAPQALRVFSRHVVADDGTCANCHGFDGNGFGPYTPRLAGNSVVLDNDSSSLINLVLNGSNPLVVNGTPDPYRVPQFRQQYTDQDIAEVATALRHRHEGWFAIRDRQHLGELEGAQLW
jgi:mono/diheme cytochrome c family protein